MNNHTPKGLHEKIRSLLRIVGEVIYDDTHIINISEEEEIDKFSVVLYRVYHKNESCFDVSMEYDASAERGAGGMVYNFLPQIWDGFEGVKPMSIEGAYKIVESCLSRNKNGKCFDAVQYKLRKRIAEKKITND